MRFLLKYLIHVGSLLSLTSLSISGQELLINEFMARNETTLSDAEGDFPDWIEILNNSDEPVNLHGYHLSDDPIFPGKWSFPNLSLPPHSCLLIFASGKDRFSPEELHTNFRINGDGEVLLLSDSKGHITDRVGPVILGPDEVYGRLPDDVYSWTKMLKPTPGKDNLELNQLSLSHPGGFHKKSFKLTINPSNGDSIFYSLDGSEPGPHSNVYSEPIQVEYQNETSGELAQVPSSPSQSKINYKAWESPGDRVEKIQVFRFASFKASKRTSDIYTASYFVDGGIQKRYSLPVISLVSDPQNLINHDSGIYLPGANFDPGNPQWSGNYFQTGPEWEKPVHMEYFNSSGQSAFSLDAGIRIHGAMTRQAAQKTLRLYARESYGKEAINFPLLPQRSNEVYKRFLLRSSMCSWQGNTVVPDEVAQEICRGLDFESQEYNPVVLYLNGEYWGIHTLRDRIDERYISYLYNVDKDSVDLINGNYSLVDAGSNQAYIELAKYMEEHDLSHEEHYQHVADQVDLGSLTDYMISEIFFSNRDWPGNNQKCWRPQTPDGKWRWILFDLDAGFGEPDKDLLEQFSSSAKDIPWENNNTGAFLLKNLLKNKDFEEAFLSRFIELLNTQFDPGHTTTRMHRVMDQYRDEIPHHIDRWAYPVSVAAWERDLYEEMVSFLQKRPCYLTSQLKKYFDVEIEYECPEEPVESNLLLVVPNPSNGNFGIRNQSEEVFFGRAILCSSDGRIVAVEEQVFIPPNEQLDLNHSELGSGIYFLYLVNVLQVERKRVLIIH